jgi:hypothetical protein
LEENRLWWMNRTPSASFNAGSAGKSGPEDLEADIAVPAAYLDTKTSE